ncbi:hypothetical protein D1013_04320 [Euzebyella marina]|uniref:Alpha-L-glutamate ligase-related protein ATP-grasp domain-containing protein n=1 Tax=Euzebyella marina TaxID=1761453 RepID=A0A3G2L377_9FLAO|nr:sugar-transfer associated ATP-grasp domain-containing protein [Euzebyella marina]AYN66661.1 hypothetical protein D1013_04320 [Euzebyella marina]
MNFKLCVKKIGESLINERYHYFSNKRANEILFSIKKVNGLADKKQLRNAEEYAKDVFGSVRFAPWLKVYTSVRGEFLEGWIPDNFYGRNVITRIQGDYGKTSFLKSLSHKLFDERVCPDLAYYINGSWFDQNYYWVQNQHVADLIFSNDDKVVCKLDDTAQGKGIFFMGRNEFDLERLQGFGNFTIQRPIVQNSFFEKFNSNSVATIRLTTVLDLMGEVQLRASYLRLGRVMDTHVQSSSHIRIPIDMNTGLLSNEGYLPNWHRIEKHPDSSVGFANKYLPNFEDCVNMVIRLHNRMLMVGSIGWDVIVDSSSKPVLIEWNGYSNDIKFSEATQGPCFHDLNWHQYS